MIYKGIESIKIVLSYRDRLYSTNSYTEEAITKHIYKIGEILDMKLMK